MIYTLDEYIAKFFKRPVDCARAWNIPHRQLSDWRKAKMLFIVENGVHRRCSVRGEINEALADEVDMTPRLKKDIEMDLEAHPLDRDTGVLIECYERILELEGLLTRVVEAAHKIARDEDCDWHHESIEAAERYIKSHI